MPPTVQENDEVGKVKKSVVVDESETGATNQTVKNDSKLNSTAGKSFYNAIRKSKPKAENLDPITEKLLETKFKPKDCNLDEEEMEDLRMISTFKDNELKILRLKFDVLAADREFVTISDLKKIPEIAINPLKDRVVCCFDGDKDNKIDFREFVAAMSVFSQDGPREQKLRFAFRMHDFDDDEKISKDDLTHYLTLVTSVDKTEVDTRQQEERAKEEEEANMESLDDRIDYNESRIQALQGIKDKKNKKDNALLITEYQARINELEQTRTIQTVVERTFEEASSDQQFITLEDFSRVIGASDFQGKLVIQIC